MPPTSGPPDDQGVYGISVAAELAGLGVQTLRLYESRGLLEPARSAGGTRRYSARDVVRLRRIADLLAAGVNLAGVGLVLELQDENSDLRAANDRRSRPARARASRQAPPSGGAR